MHIVTHVSLTTQTLKYNSFTIRHEFGFTDPNDLEKFCVKPDGPPVKAYCTDKNGRVDVRKLQTIVTDLTLEHYKKLVDKSKELGDDYVLQFPRITSEIIDD